MEHPDEIGDTSTSKKHKVSALDKIDRLSTLPEPILAHILSFLPMNDAVKTIALRTFGNLWTSVHNLSFFLQLPNRMSPLIAHFKALDFVDRVFLLHESPTLLQFSLTLQANRFCLYRRLDCSGHNPCFSIFHKLDLWISSAVRKKVKILKVDILERDSIQTSFDYLLPNWVLENDFLQVIELGGCCIEPLGQIHWRSLTALSLKAVNLSDFLMEKILCGCPVLESLSLIRCYNLLNLNVTSSTNLKNLTIHFGFYEDTRLDIRVPHVKALKLSGAIWRSNLKITSSLINAHTDFCCGGTSSNVEYHNVMLILEELKHAKFLTICNWSVLVLSLPLNIGSPSLNRKGIVLMTMLTKYHFHGITFLLLNSPCLESLTLYIEPGTSLLTSDDVMWQQALGIHRDNCWTNETWLKRYDFCGEDYWASKQPCECLTNHLKTVEVYGCIVNPFVISLVKYLLRFSNVLEKVVISAKRNSDSHKPTLVSSKQLGEISQELLNSPKASSGAVLSFS